MITLTFFEHQARSYADLHLAPDDPLLEQLEEINRQAGKEILTPGRRGIKAGEMVGIVRVGAVTFQILPKIEGAEVGGAEAGGADGPPAASAAVQNLLFLLAYAYDLKLVQTNLAELAARHANWYEFLTYLFAAELHRQLRLGFSQNYVRRDETLAVMRGRWDLNRQIARHAHQRDRFAVGYDDFTADIPLNRVLLYVVERLRQSAQEERSQALLAELSARLAPVELPPHITAAEAEGVQFNRLNERFQPAFQLARLFLNHQALYLHSGPIPAFAFVMDMNRLFERFTARFIARHRREILPAAWQSARIIPQAQGSALHLARRVTSAKPAPVAQLRPDLLIQQPGAPHPLLLIDTKYKQLDPLGRRLGVSEADLYQMLAYVTRYQCPQVVLLYPQPAPRTPVHELFVLEPSQARVWIHTIDIHQPLETPRRLVGELRRIFEALSGGQP